MALRSIAARDYIGIYWCDEIKISHNLEILKQNFVMVYFEPKDLATRHIVVVGSGTLGRRVALVWAAKGNSVKLVDTNADITSKALSWIHNKLPGQVRAVNGHKGKFSPRVTPRKSLMAFGWLWNASQKSKKPRLSC